jgi:hypothetical protein
MEQEQRTVQVLLAVYNAVNSDVTRYRDYEWKITAYIGVVLVWTITMISGTRVPLDPSRCLARFFWLFITLGVYGFGLAALRHVHRSLNQRRNEKTKIEHLLHLHEPRAYGLGDANPPEGGWTKEHFDRIFEGSRGARIEGLVEGRGVFFVVCFAAYLTLLTLFAIICIFLR